MKRTARVALAVAMGLMAGMATTAFAAGTGTVTVNATINGVCTFTTDTATINFGPLDPVLAPAATQTTAAPLVFQCTNLTGYTLALSGGGAGTMSNGTDTIAYSFSTTTPLTGTAPATPINVPVTANIAAGAYLGYSVGAYTGTVTIDVTP